MCTEFDVTGKTGITSVPSDLKRKMTAFYEKLQNKEDYQALQYYVVCDGWEESDHEFYEPMLIDMKN